MIRGHAHMRACACTHTHTKVFIFPTNVPEHLLTIKRCIEKYKGEKNELE